MSVSVLHTGLRKGNRIILAIRSNLTTKLFVQLPFICTESASRISPWTSYCLVPRFFPFTRVCLRCRLSGMASTFFFRCDEEQWCSRHRQCFGALKKKIGAPQGLRRVSILFQYLLIFCPPPNLVQFEYGHILWVIHCAFLLITPIQLYFVCASVLLRCYTSVAL